MVAQARARGTYERLAFRHDRRRHARLGRQQHPDGPKRRRPPRKSTEPEQALRSLRTENEDLRSHLEIYEEQLRMLTTENKRLRELIEEQAGVTAIRRRTGSSRSRSAEPGTPSSTQ